MGFDLAGHIFVFFFRFGDGLLEGGGGAEQLPEEGKGLIHRDHAVAHGRVSQGDQNRLSGDAPQEVILTGTPPDGHLFFAQSAHFQSIRF